MKSICFLMLLFFSVASVAAGEHRGTIPISDDIVSPELTTINNTSLTQISTMEIYKQCSVTSSGTFQYSEFGSYTATITVTGPCDSSLAQKMRDAIAALRAAIK